MTREQRQRALELAGGDETIFQLASTSNPSAHARYTAAEVILALDAEGGVIAAAAKRLGCARSSVKNYIRRHPSVRRSLKATRTATCDTAKSNLAAGVMGGSIFASVSFLRIYGGNRGFGDPE